MTTITIDESVNGWRIDLFHDNVWHKEDVETYLDVLKFVSRWVTKESEKVGIGMIKYEVK